jgi:hypothetical protein
MILTVSFETAAFYAAVFYTLGLCSFPLVATLYRKRWRRRSDGGNNLTLQDCSEPNISPAADPPRSSPPTTCSSTAFSLITLLERVLDLFDQSVLERLTVTDRALFSRVSRACRDAVECSDLKRARDSLQTEEGWANKRRRARVS